MMRDGNLIGWGMASATYPMLRSEGHAKVSINLTGHVTIGAASHEIGTGTYTVMSQIAAEVLNINISKVRMNLGDTDLPANIGGFVFAIGSAMTEHSLRDKRNGRWVSDDFGIYHVPVQADIPPITVEFIPEEDKYVNPLGAKGLGELGGVGMNAAITHALYHATGVTMLDHLPYTPEALLKESSA